MDEETKKVLLEMQKEIGAEMETYANAPESAEVIKESIVERLLQDLERRMGRLKIQVENLQEQFKPILMDESASIGKEDSPQERYPAYSPLSKRLEALIELCKEVTYLLDILSEDAEI